MCESTTIEFGNTDCQHTASGLIPADTRLYFVRVKRPPTASPVPAYTCAEDPAYTYIFKVEDDPVADDIPAYTLATARD
eukprot:gene7847-883_t